MRNVIFGLALVPLMATAAMAAAGNEAAGHALAQQWCMSCHQIGPGQASAKDVAPTFVTLANEHGKDLAWVRNYLLDPHLPMMGINLSRVQIDNIVAYMRTLQRP
jgi:mono/diheme cytochrome c family protein